MVQPKFRKWSRDLMKNNQQMESFFPTARPLFFFKRDRKKDRQTDRKIERKIERKKGRKKERNFNLDEVNF